MDFMLILLFIFIAFIVFRIVSESKAQGRREAEFQRRMDRFRSVSLPSRKPESAQYPAIARARAKQTARRTTDDDRSVSSSGPDIVDVAVGVAIANSLTSDSSTSDSWEGGGGSFSGGGASGSWDSDNSSSNSSYDSGSSYDSSSSYDSGSSSDSSGSFGD